MNRRLHRWLDDHEIVKFLLLVTFFAAPSLLLCLVGFIRFAESPYRRLAVYRRRRRLVSVMGDLEISLSLPPLLRGRINMAAAAADVLDEMSRAGIMPRQMPPRRFGFPNLSALPAGVPLRSMIARYRRPTSRNGRT